MSDTYALLNRLIETCQDQINVEDQEALFDLARIYQPYQGDDPAEAQGRAFMQAHCTNCRFVFPGMPMPADLGRAALSALRHAACPRCFANTGILIGDPATKTKGS